MKSRSEVATVATEAAAAHTALGSLNTLPDDSNMSVIKT